MKKLEYWKAKLKEVKNPTSSWFRQHGFRHCMCNGSSIHVWINKSKRVVIKIPYIVDTNFLRSRERKFAIPYLKYKKWTIQPLCHVDKKARKKAYKIFCALKDNYYFADEYNLEFNVGMYRNKPVIFDW